MGVAEAKLSKLYKLYTRAYGNKNMVDRRCEVDGGGSE